MKSKQIHEIMIKYDTSHEGNKQGLQESLGMGRDSGQGGPLCGSGIGAVI